MTATIDETETEVELRELVYSMIRMLKPELVVETGAYLGGMTATLGVAVRDNGVGRVVSCETDFVFLKRAMQRCRELPVAFYAGPSTVVPELERADFLFLDSDYQYRGDEIRRAKPGATIVIHDAFKSYDPNVPPLADSIRAAGGLCWPCGIDGRGFGILIK